MLFSVAMWAKEGGKLTSSATPINPTETVTLSYDGTGTNFANWQPKCFIHTWLVNKEGETFSGNYNMSWASCNSDADYNSLPAKVKMTFVSNGKYSISMNIKEFFNVADDDLAKISKIGVIVRAQYSGDNNQTNDFFITVSIPDPEAPQFYVTGDSALVVDAGFSASKKWNADAIPSEKDTFVLNLKSGVEYKLKVTADGTWDSAMGYDDLTEVTDGLTQDSDGNICFQITADGAVKVIFTNTVFKVLGEFVAPCAESYGLMIDGVYHPGTRNNLQTEWIEYVLRNVVLTKGQRIKVHSVCADATWVINKYAETSYELPIVDGAYVVEEDGTYDFYIKFIFEADEMYIAKHGTYTTAVRSQCTDVLMQAFFNESYNNSAPGVGDDDYHLNLGNTKWTTLLPQAEEIGHYFDLVWLPPSANGSGMGYHPKQYSNQNSNWGSSDELKALIDALHDAGSKVVADIVINHCEGWTSWCDFPELDFGEYGKFYPDASYICQNDEVNAEWNKESAGACWGTASGNYDDGENWEGARDWAHDAVKVQNMFKAYLKWMRNVVGYDGFRYDKGDGFNNWHHDNYNKNAGPYIAFMECYSNTDVIKSRIEGANYNLMALDFDTKWHVFDSFAGWDFSRGRGNGLLGQNWSRYAVTFIDSHDWFLRSDNENEFGGRGNSLKEALKPRLLMANAFLLSMPGVPCVFYPHWAKYKGFLKKMIEARKLAGVHSESEVKDEYVTATGYQATIVGKDGYLILSGRQGAPGFQCQFQINVELLCRE